MKKLSTLLILLLALHIGYAQTLVQIKDYTDTITASLVVDGDYVVISDASVGENDKKMTMGELLKWFEAATFSNIDINAGTVDGITSLTASGNLDIGNHQLRAETLRSDVATGTAPFTVASTTAVTSLNVDRVDDCHVGSTSGALPKLCATTTSGELNTDYLGTSIGDLWQLNGNGMTGTSTSVTTGSMSLTDDGLGFITCSTALGAINLNLPLADADNAGAPALIVLATDGGYDLTVNTSGSDSFIRMTTSWADDSKKTTAVFADAKDCMLVISNGAGYWMVIGGLGGTWTP